MSSKILNGQTVVSKFSNVTDIAVKYAGGISVRLLDDGDQSKTRTFWTVAAVLLSSRKFVTTGTLE